MTSPTQRANKSNQWPTTSFPSNESLDRQENISDNIHKATSSPLTTANNEINIPSKNISFLNTSQISSEQTRRLSYITMYETSLNKRLSTGGIGAIVGKFNSAIQEHEKKQCLNPFSNSFNPDMANSNRPDPSDSLNYGRPVRGSKTDIRAQEAARHIQREVELMLELVKKQGSVDPANGLTFITFGRLFSLYNNISDKLVGILLRARRHGLVAFQGEMLYQRRDEAEPIYLLYESSSEPPLTESQTDDRLKELQNKSCEIQGDRSKLKARVNKEHSIK